MRKCKKLVDLEKYEKMRHFSLSEALIQPRTSSEKSDVSWPCGRDPPELPAPAARSASTAARASARRSPPTQDGIRQKTFTKIINHHFENTIFS